MKKCPTHLVDYVEQLPNQNKFIEYEGDDYTIPYLIKCNCKSEEFVIYKNEMPTVKAICIQCNKDIILYDLNYYPASSIVKCNEEFTKYISPEGDTKFQICAVFEYSEEEEDVEFNPNDITWCEIYGFVEQKQKCFKIISDETA